MKWDFHPEALEEYREATLCYGMNPIHLDLCLIRRTVFLMTKPLITCSPEVMGGTPVFAGTRVPVQTFLDYLEAGETIDNFLEGFPTVSRVQVVAFLEEAKDRMVAAVS